MTIKPKDGDIRDYRKSSAIGRSEVKRREGRGWSIRRPNQPEALEMIVGEEPSERIEQTLSAAERELLGDFGITDTTLQDELYNITNGEVAKQLLAIAIGAPKYEAGVIASVYFSAIAEPDTPYKDHLRAQLIRVGAISEHTDICEGYEGLERFVSSFLKLQESGLPRTKTAFKNATESLSDADVGYVEGRGVLVKDRRAALTPSLGPGSSDPSYGGSHVTEHDASRTDR